MLEMVQVLEAWNSEENQASLEGHGTRVPAANAAFETIDQLTVLVGPYAKLYEAIGQLCNLDALDEEELDKNSFVAGRSSLAHEILRMMANTEHEVRTS